MDIETNRTELSAVLSSTSPRPMSFCELEDNANAVNDAPPAISPNDNGSVDRTYLSQAFHLRRSRPECHASATIEPYSLLSEHDYCYNERSEHFAIQRAMQRSLAGSDNDDIKSGAMKTPRLAQSQISVLKQAITEPGNWLGVPCQPCKSRKKNSKHAETEQCE